MYVEENPIITEVGEKKFTSCTKLSLGMSWPTENICIPDTDRKEKTLLTEKVEVLWKLPNISRESLPVNKSNVETFKKCFVSSDTFEAGRQVGRLSDWRIQLNPNYQNDSEAYLSIYLWLMRERSGNKDKSIHSKQEPRFRCIYQFDLQGEDGKSICENHSGIRTFNVGDCYGWPMFIPYSDIQKFITSSKSGAMVIRLQLTVLVMKCSTSGASALVENVCGHNLEFLTKTNRAARARVRKKLRTEYRGMSVYVYSCGEGFRLNKGLLAEKSTVFYKLIQTANQINNGEDVITLHIDEDVKTLNFMFGYFNKSRKLSDTESFEERLSLLKLGIKYEVEDMTAAIFDVLFKEVNVESAAKIAAFLGSYLDSKYKPPRLQQFKKYFLKNRVAIRETESFKENYTEIKRFLKEMVLN